MVLLYFSNYIILNLTKFNIFSRLTKNSHVSTNFVHALYRMQSIRIIHLTSINKQLDPKSYKRCEEKTVETWYCLTRPIFLEYMYSVSSSIFFYYVLYVYSSSLYITPICTYKFWILVDFTVRTC